MKMKFSSEVLPHYADRWALTGATVTIYLTSDGCDYEIFRTEVEPAEGKPHYDVDELTNLHQRGVAEFAARLSTLIEKVDGEPKHG